MNATEEMVRAPAVCEHIEFSAINEAGAYVQHNTGNLLRLPEAALSTDHTPLMELVSKTPCLLTKISDDPWVAIGRARLLAADADLQVNF